MYFGFREAVWYIFYVLCDSSPQGEGVWDSASMAEAECSQVSHVLLSLLRLVLGFVTISDQELGTELSF